MFLLLSLGSVCQKFSAVLGSPAPGSDPRAVSGGPSILQRSHITDSTSSTVDTWPDPTPPI